MTLDAKLFEFERDIHTDEIIVSHPNFRLHHVYKFPKLMIETWTKEATEALEAAQKNNRLGNLLRVS